MSKSPVAATQPKKQQELRFATQQDPSNNELAVASTTASSFNTLPRVGDSSSGTLPIVNSALSLTGTTGAASLDQDRVPFFQKNWNLELVKEMYDGDLKKAVLTTSAFPLFTRSL